MTASCLYKNSYESLSYQQLKLQPKDREISVHKTPKKIILRTTRLANFVKIGYQCYLPCVFVNLWDSSFSRMFHIYFRTSETD